MWFLSGLLIFTVGGLAGRIRGSGIFSTHAEGRFGAWGTPVGILVFAMTHNPLYALAAIAMAGIGASLGYWGQYDFSVPGNWNYKNYVTLTLTGMFRFTPLFVLAIPRSQESHVLFAVLAGASFVPIYMFAFRYFTKITLGKLFNQPSCFAEFLFWGTLYTALALGLYL